jgi:hypothetical protein
MDPALESQVSLKDDSSQPILDTDEKAVKKF